MQEGTRRLLVEDSAGEAATAGVAGAGSKLGVQCQALVMLAEPGNLYQAFQDSFSATGVATQAKYLEKTLNLPVRCLWHRACLGRLGWPMFLASLACERLGCGWRL